MWLVLCSSNDVSGHWVYQGLKSRGLDPIEMIFAETLPFSLRWEHRVGSGGVSINITLPDGRSIERESVRGVINRLLAVHSAHLAHLPDGEYATQEFSALFLSWLYALPEPMLNRATPQGLSGQWRHASEWVVLAARAGLSVPFYKQSSNDQINEALVARRLFPAGTPTRTLIVAAGRVCAPDVPASIREGCVRLSEIAETPLIGIEFASDGRNEWVFAGATPLPDLRYGGQDLLDHLAFTLRGGVEGLPEGQMAGAEPTRAGRSFLAATAL